MPFDHRSSDWKRSSGSRVAMAMASRDWRSTGNLPFSSRPH
ncbi:MAG TPA: hypothetical protein QF683_01455 [SAR324 cluster bacterium]|nr:hypothetical protein [SAR324 cluster bacterium]